MKIGIITDRLGLDTGGLETYERGLLSGLAELQPQYQFEVYCSSSQAAAGIPQLGKRCSIHPVCPQSTWLRYSLGLPLRLHWQHNDVVHACFVPPWTSPRPLIVTVHDLFPFMQQSQLPYSVELRLKFLLRVGLRRASRVIAVSEKTKQDIVNLFHLDPDLVRVIHLGIDRHYQPGSEDEDSSTSGQFPLPERYILYLGRIEPRKNFGALLQAYRWLRKHRKIPQKLLVVGRIEPWGRRELGRLAPLLGEDVIFTGYLPHARLPRIYRRAEVFAFPSLAEGFGLPPLEAMASGTPVVASRIPALGEVLGSAALLVDPHDPLDLAAAILRLLEDEALREHMRLQGLAQAARFSWRETARQMLAVYQETLAQ